MLSLATRRERSPATDGLTPTESWVVESVWDYARRHQERLNWTCLVKNWFCSKRKQWPHQIWIHSFRITALCVKLCNRKKTCFKHLHSTTHHFTVGLHQQNFRRKWKLVDLLFFPALTSPCYCFHDSYIFFHTPSSLLVFTSSVICWHRLRGCGVCSSVWGDARAYVLLLIPLCKGLYGGALLWSGHKPRLIGGKRLGGFGDRKRGEE